MVISVGTMALGMVFLGFSCYCYVEPRHAVGDNNVHEEENHVNFVCNDAAIFSSTMYWTVSPRQTEQQVQHCRVRQGCQSMLSEWRQSTRRGGCWRRDVWGFRHA